MNKKNITTIAIVAVMVVITLVISSCSSIVLCISTSGSAVKRSTRFVNEELDKEVIFVPMVHVGKERYYEEVKVYLANLRKDGYAICHEGIHLKNPDLDSASIDTLKRKFRRLAGASVDYSDLKNNKSLPRQIRKSKYVGQTLDRIGADPEQDYLFDLSVEELIMQYESKVGRAIQLTDYDFATPLNAPFEPNDEFVLKGSLNTTGSLRENHLIKQLLESDEKKLVVVWGVAHYRFLKLDLKYLKGFKQDKKYKARKKYKL